MSCWLSGSGRYVDDGLSYCDVSWVAFVCESHSVSEVRRRWFAEDQVGDEVDVVHVTFIKLAEVDGRAWKQVQSVGFLFGRRVGLLFVCVFWFSNR